MSQASGMKFWSPEIPDGGRFEHRHVLNGFGCEGGNQSPALEWSGAPAGTKSFAITCYDPDAPTGSGWWHWVMFDVPGTATKLDANAGDPAGGRVPAGAKMSNTDFGKPGYGGPCPPPGHGPHRYVFTLHALKCDALGIDPATSTAAFVGFNLHFNVLATASFTLHFGR